MQHEIIPIKLNYEQMKLNNGGFQPTLTTYILDNYPEIDMGRKRPMVLICPGGAYRMCSEREAEPIAIQMIARGYHAAVIHYSTAPIDFPVPLLELATAVAMIREHASEWNVDPDQIIVCGFSAGGHLACSLGVYWNHPLITDYLNLTHEQVKPNGLILCYPVITAGVFAHQESMRNGLGRRYEECYSYMSLEEHISEDMPPVFIWHTDTDQSVPVENTLLLASALKKYQISMELHIYPAGPHGLALANEETVNIEGQGIQSECSGWIELAGVWIRNLQVRRS